MRRFNPASFSQNGDPKRCGKHVLMKGTGNRGLEEGHDPSHGDVQILQVLLSTVFVFGCKLS